MTKNDEAIKKKVICGNMLMSKCTYPDCSCEDMYGLQYEDEKENEQEQSNE